MSTVIRPLSNGVAIDTANTVSDGTIIFVNNNSNQPANLIFSYSNGTQYASMALDHTSNYVIVKKDATDKLTGTGMVATSIAWPKG